MSNYWVPPSFIFVVAAIPIPFLRDKIQRIYVLVIPLIGIFNLFLMQEGLHWSVDFLDQTLVLARVDKLSFLFALVFMILHFVGMLFANHIKEHWEHSTAFLYAGGTLGVVFAGDFLSLYFAWEFMAGASMCIIWNRMNKPSWRAGYRFILVHFTGGLFLLAGFIIHYRDTGSLEFGHMGDGGLAFNFVLIAFLVNAAVPPLSAWLSDSYPESTVTGTVFLSGFTTKSAVYVLARGYGGTEILVWMGVAMTLYGVIFAALENDIRRLLAYHVISQVGYMVAGVGIGTELAINGVCAHAFSHIIYKSLLFMGAGTVLHMAGTSKMTGLGGIYKYMKPTFILYMIGGLSISAFPLFNGFISKSMTVTAAAEDHRFTIWILLTLASCGTFLSIGLKLPYFTFLGKDSGLRPKAPPVNMIMAMGIAALLCIVFGIYPKLLYDLLPYNVDYKPYTVSHVVSSLQMLLFTGLAFFFLIKKAGSKSTISIDTDWFYRKASEGFLWLVDNPIFEFANKIKTAVFVFIPQALILMTKDPTTIIKLSTDMVALMFSSDEQKRKEITDRVVMEKSTLPSKLVRPILISEAVFVVCCLLLFYLFIYFVTSVPSQTEQ